MTEPYQPIACALHDEYEIAIMHKKSLNISWIDSSEEVRKATVHPKDILVKDKQEFLIVDTQENGELCIRLDMVTLLES